MTDARTRRAQKRRARKRLARWREAQPDLWRAVLTLSTPPVLARRYDGEALRMVRVDHEAGVIYFEGGAP